MVVRDPAVVEKRLPQKQIGIFAVAQVTREAQNLYIFLDGFGGKTSAEYLWYIYRNGQNS